MACISDILFFEKGKKTEEIWFFEHPYPEGYKSYSRSKPLTIQEFDLEKGWWHHRRVNEYAWKVTAGEIAARNYNLDCKNPHVVEVEHGDPAELMAEFLQLSQQVKEIQDALKSELMQALGDGK